MSVYQDGDIVLSRESTFSSWIIRKFTRSDWSHAGLYIADNQLASAVPMQGVCIRELAVAKTRSIYRYIGLVEEQRQLIRNFITNNVGKKYDMMQVFLLAWRIITGKIDKNEGDPNPEAFECLEFVAEAYLSAGIKICKIADNLLPNMITTSPLFERIA
jgi:uncharacterized protein YycO